MPVTKDGRYHRSFRDPLNSTSATLAGGATWTGQATEDNHKDVMVTVFSDVTGTVFIDFSIDDGVNWDTTVSQVLKASVTVQRIIPKGNRCCRVRYVNGATAQSAFRLQTEFGDLQSEVVLTSNMNIPVGVTDHNALQVTAPTEGKSAFGEMLVAELSQKALLDFIYGINTDLVVTQGNQSGSVTAANSLGTAATGAAANSSGTFRTRSFSQYKPGQGSRARFTAVFTTGVADSHQIAGLGDASNGFFFGYNGTAFGILHRFNGSPEIRTLTLTVASSTAEDITITLDGVAAADVTVTASAALTVTANEIAAHDYSSVGRGWDAHADGDTVVFVSWDASVRTGTYTLSSATTAVGTFAQTVAGIAPTDTWIPQASWNGKDRFDGNGNTGVTIDPTKGNTYQISMQWLGFGTIKFFVEDPDDGEFHEVHGIEYSNANTTPSTSNPNLPLLMQAENVANTSDLSVSTASCALFTDGKAETLGPRKGASATVVLTGVTTETPCMTLCNRIVNQGRENKTQAKLLYVTAAVEHSKTVQIKLHKNQTLVGASFAALDSNSPLSLDTSATSSSGGTELMTLSLGKSGNSVIDLSGDFFTGFLQPGDAITATVLPASVVGAEGSVSFTLAEIF